MRSAEDGVFEKKQERKKEKSGETKACNALFIPAREEGIRGR